MANLSPTELKQLEYGQEVKHFIEGDAWKELVYPAFVGLVNKNFPDPKEEGWEEEYRKAYALNQAIATLKSTMENLASNAEALRRKQSNEEPDMNEA